MATPKIKNPNLLKIAQNLGEVRKARASAYPIARRAIIEEQVQKKERDKLFSLGKSFLDLGTTVAQVKEGFETYKRGGGEAGFIEFLRNPEELQFYEKGLQAKSQGKNVFYDRDTDAFVNAKPYDGPMVDMDENRKELQLKLAGVEGNEFRNQQLRDTRKMLGRPLTQAEIDQGGKTDYFLPTRSFDDFEEMGINTGQEKPSIFSVLMQRGREMFDE